MSHSEEEEPFDDEEIVGETPPQQQHLDEEIVDATPPPQQQHLDEEIVGATPPQQQHLDEEIVDETPPQQQHLDDARLTPVGSSHGDSEETVEEKSDESTRLTPVGSSHGDSEETVEEKSDESMDIGERQTLVDVACDLLIKIGFKRDMFTIDNIFEHGLKDDEFLEIIKPIAPITDMEELKSVTGTNRNNFQKFIDRMKFLKSIEGIHIVNIALNNMKKKKMNKDDVVRAQKLVHYANSRREYGKSLSDQINDLAKKKKVLELEYAKIEQNLDKNLGPLCAYEELPMDEVKFQAYELYKKDCESKGELAISDEYELGVLTALEKFGEAVKERGFLNFLNGPSRRMELEKHLKKKIIRFEYADKKHDDAGGESSKTAAKIVVYKFGSDVFEGAECCENFVVSDSRDDETAAKIVYKFGSDVPEAEGGGSGNPKKKKRKRVETRDFGKGNVI